MIRPLPLVSPLIVLLTVLLTVLPACDFFADDGFPCASDGSCPGALFCVDGVCRTDDPTSGREQSEGEGEQSEGEGEGAQSEGEGEEGEGEAPGSGFVFVEHVLDLPSENFYIAAAGKDRVVIAGWTSDAFLDTPATGGMEERLFVTRSTAGAPFTLVGDDVVERNKTHFDAIGFDRDSSVFVVDGFASGFLSSDTDLDACHLADAGRLSVFSLEIPLSGGCAVAGRITATSLTAVNKAKALSARRFAGSRIFGIQVSTNEGAVYDVEVPTTATLNSTDYGTMWVSSDDGGAFETGVAESYFLSVADAHTLTVGGASDVLDGEPQTFQGAPRAPQTGENGLVGFAQTPARSVLFGAPTSTTVNQLTHINDDPVVFGKGADRCDGVFVSRLDSTLQSAVWTAELCTDSVVSVDSVLVDDGEVLVFFLAGGPVSFPDGQVLVGSGGPIAGAFDAETGSLLALANAFAEGFDDAASEDAIGAVPFACGASQEFACAISAHRRK